MKCQILFSRKNKETTISLSSAEFAPSLVCVNLLPRGAKLKDLYLSKSRHFIIQERFNKLVCGINTIIKCDT